MERLQERVLWQSEQRETRSPGLCEHPDLASLEETRTKQGEVTENCPAFASAFSHASVLCSPVSASLRPCSTSGVGHGSSGNF